MSTPLLILGIVLFILLIVVHEYGHFIAARKGGVEVEEFGIFFPPTLWKRKMKGGWDFTVNLLPLGGFVRLKGEHDSDTRKGSFGAASLATKVKIMLAGVGMNLLVAFILLTVLAWVGMPQLIDRQFTVKSDTEVIRQASTQYIVQSVQPQSPALEAGIKAQDRVVAIGPSGKTQKVSPDNSIPDITKKYAGQEVVVTYERNGVTKNTALKLNTGEQAVSEGYLGIRYAEQRKGITLQRSTWSAPVAAAGVIGQFTGLTFQGLGKALAGLGSTLAGAVTGNTEARQQGQTNASSQVGGPVAIVVLLKEGAALGFQFVLMVIALISLTLAIMNVLPIPALDGGKLFVTLLARAFRKTLSERAEMAIYGTGFAVLMLLLVVITIVDVKRFF